MKKQLALYLCLVFLVICNACSLRTSLQLPSDSAILIFQSNLFTSTGLASTFNEKGDLLFQAQVPLGNANFSCISNEGYFCAMGHRRNLNAFFHDQKLDTFSLLDDPNYTGSTSAILSGDELYSSMNGAIVKEEGYLCILVARNMKTGKTLYKKDVPLYVEEIDDHGDSLYLIGSDMRHPDAKAILLSVDKKRVIY